jgi:hypothetical protein
MKKFLALSLVCLSPLLASCNPPAENGDSSSAEETTSSAESSPSAEDQSKYQVEAAQITAIFEPSRTRNLTVEHTEKLKESDKENRSKGVSKIVGDEAQVAIETEAGASGAEGTVVDGRIVERPEGMLKAYMSYVKASPDFANPPRSEVQAWEEKTYPDVASFLGDYVLEGAWMGISMASLCSFVSVDEATFKKAFAYDASSHAYKGVYVNGDKRAEVDVAFLDQVLQTVTISTAPDYLPSGRQETYFHWAYRDIGTTAIDFLTGEKGGFDALIEKAAYQGENIDSGSAFSCVTIQSKAYLTKGGKQYGQFDVSIGANGDARFLMQHFASDGSTVKDSKTILMRLDVEAGKWADIVFPTAETVTFSNRSASHGDFGAFAPADCNVKGLYAAEFLVYDLDRSIGI